LAVFLIFEPFFTDIVSIHTDNLAGDALMFCPYHEKCPMFGNQICTEFPPLSEKLKDQYCRGKFETCARKCVRETIGKEFVPQMMLPQQHDWARQILTDKEIGITQINLLLGPPKKAKRKA
jgi:hypothetical protein